MKLISSGSLRSTDEIGLRKPKFQSILVRPVSLFHDGPEFLKIGFYEVIKQDYFTPMLHMSHKSPEVRYTKPAKRTGNKKKKIIDSYIINPTLCKSDAIPKTFLRRKALHKETLTRLKLTSMLKLYYQPVNSLQLKN